MYDRILVPTDGSDVAAAAADAALELAGRFDSEVHALYVQEGDVGGEDAGARATDDVAERASAVGLEATATVVAADGPVHDAILDYAADNAVDCVVIGTYGRTGIDRFVLGSVAERTLREAPMPVLTVHEETELSPAFTDVLVPTDGSEDAAAAGDHAIELALATGATLHAVNAVDLGVVWDEYDATAVLASLEAAGERAVSDLAERALAAGVDEAETSVFAGPIARSIADYADEHDVSAIVIGTHGRTGIERFFLGSVTERLVRITEVPVITVKAPEEGDDDA